MKESKVVIHVRVSDRIRRIGQARAALLGLTVSDYIGALIEKDGGDLIEDPRPAKMTLSQLSQLQKRRKRQR